MESVEERPEPMIRLSRGTLQILSEHGDSEARELLSSDHLWYSMCQGMIVSSLDLLLNAEREDPYVERVKRDLFCRRCTKRRREIGEGYSLSDCDCW